MKDQLDKDITLEADDDLSEADEQDADEVEEVDASEAEEADGEAEEAPETGADEAEGDGDGDGLALTFGDEEGPDDESEETPVFTDLRRQLREALKENARLKKSQPEPVKKLRPKPTLADHQYKDAAFEADLAQWFEEKAEVDAQEREQKAKSEKVQQEHLNRVNAYQARKVELSTKHKVDDFDDVERGVIETLSDVQQSITLSVCEDPAKLVYALGKSDKQLDALSKIDDPVQFAAAVAKLEAKMTVSKRRKAPPPERRVRGSGPAPGTGDQTLDRLEAEADKTGDRSKVLAYKRKLKAAK